MAQKITWDNKVQGRDLPLVPITQKLTFGELNDLKTKFNANADELEEATSGLAGKLPIGGGGLGIKVFRPILGIDGELGFNKTVITSSINLSSLTPSPLNTLVEIDASEGPITITVNIIAAEPIDFFEIEFLPIDLTNDVTFASPEGIILNSIDGYLKLDKAFGGTILKYRGGTNFVLIGNLKA